MCSKQLDTCKKDPVCVKLHQKVELAMKAEHGGQHHHSGDKKPPVVGGRRQLEGSASQGTGECVRAFSLLCGFVASLLVVLVPVCLCYCWVLVFGLV